MEEGGTTGQGGGLAARWQGLSGPAVLLAAALLHTLAFPPFNLAEAAYVFAVPLLLWGLFTRPARGEGLALLAGGWLSWFALLYWLRNFTRHLDLPLAAALGWLALLALSFALAVFWWAWGRAALAAARAAARGGFSARLAALLGLPALWVVMEWIRTFILTGFPWLPLSASQWQRPLLLQITSVTGGAGLSFVLVAFNLGLALYLHNLWRNRRAGWLKRLSPEFYIALGLLFGAIAHGLHTSGAGRHGRVPGPRIGLIQPDVGAIEKWTPALMQENLQVLNDLTLYASYLGAELVLWPESPTPLPVKGNDSMQAWVEALARETGLPLLIGNIAREGAAEDPGRRWYNAVFVVDPEDGVAVDRYYGKRHLVPFGEYVPLARLLPFLRKVVPVEGEFSLGESAAPLTLPPPVASAGRVGILICYEDVFPALARANTLAGADWHFVATNNNWFGREAGAWQHAAHSVLRAVETRRPVVRCGNAGWSGWIDEFGHIRHVMLNDRGSIYFQGAEAVPFSRSAWWAGRLSPYVRHGDWFIAVSGALALLLVVPGIFRALARHP